jgi:histidinol-phosphate phosphatase family protein
MNKRPAVFLDRDGTIIEDRGYIADNKDILFFPYTFEALQLLQKQYVLFIVTNQSGVGMGFINRETADKTNEYVMYRLKEEDITIARLYCCTHKREDNCRCIKPNPFFLFEAERDFKIDLKRSFVIGDHPHDVEFARSAGLKGLYVLTGHGEKHLNKVPPETDCFFNVLDAACCIVKKPLLNLTSPMEVPYVQ